MTPKEKSGKTISDKLVELLMDAAFKVTPEEKSALLPIPTAARLAEQCRQMGLAVGDVIQGREEAPYRDGGFHEARLEIVWLGETVAVFREQKRSDISPEWSDPREETAWTLDCRRWLKK